MLGGLLVYFRLPERGVGCVGTSGDQKGAGVELEGLREPAQGIDAPRRAEDVVGEQVLDGPTMSAQQVSAR